MSSDGGGFNGHHRPNAWESSVQSAKPDITLRACNACRKMKIRCIDKEDPPCRRCRNMGLPCQFEGDKSRPDQWDRTADPRDAGRLQQLEGQMSTVTSRLDQISSLLLGIVSGSNSGNNINIAHDTNERPQTSNRPSILGLRPASVPNVHQDNPGRMADGSNQWWDPVTAPTRPAGSAGPSSNVPNNTVHAFWGRPNDLSPISLTAGSINHGLSTEGQGGLSNPSLQQQLDQEVILNNTRLPVEQQPLQNGPDSENSNSDEDDPLVSAVRQEPFRMMTNREEQARLREEGHATQGGTQHGSQHNQTPSDSWPDDSSRPSKRARTTPGGTTYDARGQLVQKKGDTSGAFLNPVQLGFCSEEQGKQMFELFMQHSHPFMPVLDPAYDTWDALVQRSAFCITVVIMVVSQIHDGSGPPSLLTRRCRQQAEHMAKVTLFSPVSAIETVQATVILACWSDVVWRPACHAMTLAVDMEMHRCLPVLQEQGMGAGKTVEELEKDRPLVIGARVWLALTKLAYEVAYNHARPLAFHSDVARRLGRKFLQHPLSSLEDSRFVISVELQSARECLFHPFDMAPQHERSEVDDRVKSVRNTLAGLYDFWLDYYLKAGLPADHFYVQELGSQRAYGDLHTNCTALRGLHDKHDVLLLSEEKRECLLLTIRAAAWLVNSIGNGGQATNAEYGNHYFHVGVVSTARFLIRLLGLMPEAVDLDKARQDLEALISHLPKFPGLSFARLLRSDFSKAQRQGVLAPSPGHPPPAPSSDQGSASVDQPIFNSDIFAWLSNPGNLDEEPSLRVDGLSATDGTTFPWIEGIDFSQSFSPWTADNSNARW